jgi:uncharacterized membrane protein YgaE (UPF0421/DUF939 family)
MDFSRFITAERTPVIQVVKSTTAAVTAWFICVLIFPEQIPIFGAIAALITVQENVSQSLTRGIERVIGVVVGVTVALGAAIVFGATNWLFVVAIMVSITLGWLVKMSSGSTNQVAITALLMIALGATSLMQGFERIVETLIGAVIGFTMNALIVAPVKINPAREAINTLGYEASLGLEKLADALSEPRDRAWMHEMMLNARLLLAQRNRISLLKQKAYETLQFNPRAQRYRLQLEQDDRLLKRLDPIVNQIVGMTRALYDNYDADLIEDQGIQGLSVEMRKAAHDLRLLITPDFVQRPDAATKPIPALTAPYIIYEPNPKHWVLIGSLLEDMRRLRNRILTGE